MNGHPSIAQFCFDLISWLEFFRTKYCLTRSFNKRIWKSSNSGNRNSKNTINAPKFIMHQNSCLLLAHAHEHTHNILYVRISSFFFTRHRTDREIVGKPRRGARKKNPAAKKYTLFNTYLDLIFTMIMIVINIEHGFCIKFHILLNFPYICFFSSFLGLSSLMRMEFVVVCCVYACWASQLSSVCVVRQNAVCFLFISPQKLKSTNG